MPSQASNAHASAQGQVPWLAAISPEIRLLILSFLTNRDRKCLRLTCKVLSDVTPLCLSRLFLSANPLDIEVFHAIADHPQFRRQIKEIIWDDARFVSTPPLSDDYWWEVIEGGIQSSPQLPELDSDSDSNSESSLPRWFRKECENNIQFIEHRKCWDRDLPHHITRQKQVDAQMSLHDCWELYQNYIEQQEEVISSRRDEKAFIYGLDRFPALKKVTVTPAVHGWLFSPLYETPMIRSLPYGFNYPIPRGWPTATFGENPTYPVIWSRAPETYKEQWHGVRIALRILAQHDDNISELSFDPFLLVTGINYSMVDQPSDEYNHFLAIMKRPRFSHLKLPLFVGGNGTYYWAQESRGYLYRALREAKDLEYVSLSTTIGPRPIDPPIILKNVFPVEHWPALRHFGLWRFDASKSDIIDLVKLLPRTLRSLDFGLNYFQTGGDCLNDLLEAIRIELRSDETIKPSVRIVMPGYMSMVGRGVWLDDEVNEFLYGSGENPMQGRDSKNPKFGMGTLRDLFEPEFTRPNLELRQLSELGIIRWP
ncbi:hypothetical protein PEBR_39645 [Penicillium brasilianum]|uniref:F-box domain-containing protein n=1 Tax=Penicillium brasilianum TaxID=104259 RepID=A0A1S9R9Q1_PENBI|nr:hypothetical protein PEBR_39645 [Penicillium brasilianum]